MFQWLNKSAIW